MTARDALMFAIERAHHFKCCTPEITREIIAQYQQKDIDAAVNEAIAALRAGGFEVVPREPTEAMVRAGIDAADAGLHSEEAQYCYRAMVLQSSSPEER